MPTINLHLGDSLAAMRQMPDKCYDLAIVDPPYGLNMETGNNNRIKKQFGNSKKSWDASIPPKEYFDHLFRVSKNQVIWGANYMVEHLPPSMGWVCWFKTFECVGRAFSECEFAFTSFQQASRIIELKPFQRNGSRVHPTQKPSELYKHLLDRLAKPGDKILDTHAGSFSIGIACHDMGFDLDAWEIDPDYYAAALKRYNNHVSQLNLFVA